jgi:hypothetical protein
MPVQNFQFNYQTREFSYQALEDPRKHWYVLIFSNPLVPCQTETGGFLYQSVRARLKVAPGLKSRTRTDTFLFDSDPILHYLDHIACP